MLLIRTGHIVAFTVDRDRVAYMRQMPGLGMACVEWLHAREVAAVASDTNMVEVWPPEDPQVLFPLHMLCIRDMGLTLGEMFDLEALAADCAAGRRLDVSVHRAAAARDGRCRLADQSPGGEVVSPRRRVSREAEMGRRPTRRDSDSSSCVQKCTCPSSKRRGRAVATSRLSGVDCGYSLFLTVRSRELDADGLAIWFGRWQTACKLPREGEGHETTRENDGWRDDRRGRPERLRPLRGQPRGVPGDGEPDRLRPVGGRRRRRHAQHRERLHAQRAGGRGRGGRCDRRRSAGPDDRPLRLPC